MKTRAIATWYLGGWALAFAAFLAATAPAASAQSRSVQVLVRDDRGPVLGAKVTASGPDWANYGDTGGTGLVTLSLIRSSPFTLTVASPAHEPKRMDNVTIPSAGRIEVVLTRGVARATLRVRIVDAATNAPVAGARVQLREQASGRTLERVTDAGGVAAFEGVEPGFVTPTITASGYDTVTGAGTKVGPGVANMQYPIYGRTAAMAVVVRNESGQPVAGASVRATIVGGGGVTGPAVPGKTYDATTDGSGTARLSLLPAVYDIVASAKDYKPGGANRVTAPATGPVQITLAGERRGTLAVAVQDAGTQRFLEGVTVSLSGPASRSGVTGTSQQIAPFQDLPFGTYTVTVSAPGYSPATSQVSVTSPVPVSHRVVITKVTAPPPPSPPASAVRVKVQDERGRAVAGAKVVASGSWGGGQRLRLKAEGTTDGAGQVTLNLPQGGYSVVVTAGGYKPVETSATLTPSAVATIVLRK